MSICKRHPGACFLLLLSAVLICAAAARFIEYNGGSTLIHSIRLESYNSFFFDARIYRPIQANALNPRPAVLLLAGEQTEKEIFTPLALELARRGMVALLLDDFGQGNSLPKPDDPDFAENTLDAAYDYLVSRTYIRPDKIAVLAYDSAVTAMFYAQHPTDFNATILISPSDSTLKTQIAKQTPPNLLVLQARFEEFCKYRWQQRQQITFPTTDGVTHLILDSTHRLMPLQPESIRKSLTWFGETLKIDNDVPLWFDPSALIYPIRSLCLLLVFILLLVSLLPLGFLVQKLPFFRSGVCQHKRMDQPRSIWLAVYVILSLILFVVITSHPIGGDGQSGYSHRSSDTIIIYFAALCALLLLTRRFDRRAYSHPPQEIMRQILLAVLLFSALYGIVYLFNLLNIQIRFIIPLLSPLKENQMIAFCAYSLILSLFFCLSGDRPTLLTLSAVLLFLMLEYLPLFFGSTPIWELLGTASPNGWGQTASQAASIWSIGTLLLFYQKQQTNAFGACLHTSLLSGSIFAWILLNGAVNL